MKCEMWFWSTKQPKLGCFLRYFLKQSGDQVSDLSGYSGRLGNPPPRWDQQVPQPSHLICAAGRTVPNSAGEVG